MKIREFLLGQFPDRKIPPLGREAAEENPQQNFDASKAAKTFGINFRTFDEVLKDFTDFVFSYEKQVDKS